MGSSALRLLMAGLIGAACLSGCSSSPTPSVEAQSARADELSASEDVRKAQRQASTASRDQFPSPPELEPQVAFWRQVYGNWSRSKVAIHDDRYLDIIYELVELPGPIQEGYTAAQKDLISRRKEYWQDRLRGLAEAWTLSLPLSPADRALLTPLEAAADRNNAVLGAADRVRAQRGLRERFKRGLEISGRYDASFRRIFRDAGLPEDLAYLPHVESSFQAHARSSAGAVGIWQFTRSAARRFMNMNDAVDERLDPVASARGAARYLSYAHGKLSHWPLTLTSYNHGIAGMQKARDAVGDDFIRIVRHYDHPKFGFASRNFYAEFLAAREIARQPDRYFPEGLHSEQPLAWDRIVLSNDTVVSDLAQRFAVDRERLIGMNAAWSEPATREEVPLPAGTEVWLPPTTARGPAGRDQGSAFESGPVPATPSE